MTGQSSMATLRIDLTRASPASLFAAMAAMIRHSRHRQEHI
jgi:hypothetical protein